MKLAEIVLTLDASLLTGKAKLDTDIGRCGASDLMSDILASLAEGSLLLTGLTSLQTVRTASIAGVGAIAFVRGKVPPAEVVQLADAHGLSADLDSLFHVRRLRTAARLPVDRAERQPLSRGRWPHGQSSPRAGKTP